MLLRFFLKFYCSETKKEKVDNIYFYCFNKPVFFKRYITGFYHLNDNESSSYGIFLPANCNCV